MLGLRGKSIRIPILQYGNILAWHGLVQERRNFSALAKTKNESSPYYLLRKQIRSFRAFEGIGSINCEEYTHLFSFMFRYVDKLLTNAFQPYVTLSTNIHNIWYIAFIFMIPIKVTVSISSTILSYKLKQAQFKQCKKAHRVKIWTDVLESEIDVNTSQPMSKHNLKRCMLQCVICQGYQQMTT